MNARFPYKVRDALIVAGWARGRSEPVAHLPADFALVPAAESQQQLLVDDSLDELSRCFDAAQFLRVHRSAISRGVCSAPVTIVSV